MNTNPEFWYQWWKTSPIISTHFVLETPCLRVFPQQAVGIAQVFFCCFSSRWRMAAGLFRSCTVWFYPAQFQSESKFLWCFVCFEVKIAVKFFVHFQVIVSVMFSIFPSQHCCDVLYVSKAKLLCCFVRFQISSAVMHDSFRVAYNQCSRSAQKLNSAI